MTNKKKEVTKVLEDLITGSLGFYGHMLSGSKSGYDEQNSKSLTIFNANLIITGYGKVWHGDIDITKSEEQLKFIAKGFGGAVIYVLYEMDGRFDNEENPKIEQAVYQTDGELSIIGDRMKQYYVRNGDSGKIERTNAKK